jgi:hypothetical protein
MVLVVFQLFLANLSADKQFKNILAKRHFDGKSIRIVSHKLLESVAADVYTE